MTSLKFEVGKFYADRKGRKWECVCVDNDNYDYPIIAVRRFKEKGVSGIGKTDFDLIAEWVEPNNPSDGDLWRVSLDDLAEAKKFLNQTKNLLVDICEFFDSSSRGSR